MGERKSRAESQKAKKHYKRPAVSSETYLERGALACNKMGGTSRRCSANPGVS